MIDVSKEKEVFLNLELDTKSLYFARKTVGGSKLLKLEKKEDSGLIKIKIDEQVFQILGQKRKRNESMRMAVERAILTML